MFVGNIINILIVSYLYSFFIVRLLENNLFRNPIKNFQNALLSAKGDVIFLSDQDDVWLANKYERTIELLEKYDLVVSDSILTDGNLNPTNLSLLIPRSIPRGSITWHRSPIKFM